MFEAIKKFLKKDKKVKKDNYCSAIIVAAGKGVRMKAEMNKQFINIIDRPVLAYTLEAFETCELINEIIVVTREEDIILCKEIVDISELTKVSKIVAGGKERQESVYKGLQEIDHQATIVSIHDGARPLILPEHIEDSIKAVTKYDAVAVGVKVKDTIKVVDREQNITSTLDRDMLWAVQTPQTFRAELIKDAHKKAIDGNIQATDDCMLVEQMGIKVKLIEGSYDNIKITTPEDILFAEAIIEGKEIEDDEDFDL